MKLKIHIEDLLLMLGDRLVDADPNQICRITERILGLEHKTTQFQNTEIGMCVLNIKDNNPVDYGITDEAEYRYNIIKEDS